LQDDVEHSTGKMLSFSPGRQLNSNFDSLQIGQKVLMRCLLSFVFLFQACFVQYVIEAHLVIMLARTVKLKTAQYHSADDRRLRLQHDAFVYLT
jgi:hypothetical protein